MRVLLVFNSKNGWQEIPKGEANCAVNFKSSAQVIEDILQDGSSDWTGQAQGIKERGKTLAARS